MSKVYARTSSCSNRSQFEKRLVQRAGKLVQSDVHAIAEQSPFLKRPLSGQLRLAYFDRSEIRKGKLLGTGGYSLVYEISGFDLNDYLSSQLLPEYQAVREQFAKQAIDPLTGRGRFAIKHLKRDFLGNNEAFTHALSDMALEAAYLSRMDHPHILPLRGLPARGLRNLEQHDSYFLILDRLEETLDDRISSGDLNDISDQFEYAKQIAGALKYLHANRIIFRDLKPQNIGFDQEGKLRLFDFGLCRELPFDGGNDMNSVYEMSGVGTRRYLAVEVIRDACCYNAKADVYSWSMVVWQMLTGCRPYNKYSLSEHAKFVCCYGGERPNVNVSSIPTELRALLQQCWCDGVADRCSMAEVALRLTQMQKELETSAVPRTLTLVTQEGIEIASIPQRDERCSGAFRNEGRREFYEAEDVPLESRDDSIRIEELALAEHRNPMSESMFLLSNSSSSSVPLVLACSSSSFDSDTSSQILSY